MYLVFIFISLTLLCPAAKCVNDKANDKLIAYLHTLIGNPSKSPLGLMEKEVVELLTSTLISTYGVHSAGEIPVNRLLTNGTAIEALSQLLGKPCRSNACDVIKARWVSIISKKLILFNEFGLTEYIKRKHVPDEKRRNAEDKRIKAKLRMLIVGHAKDCFILLVTGFSVLLIIFTCSYLFGV